MVIGRYRGHEGGFANDEQLSWERGGVGLVREHHKVGRGDLQVVRVSESCSTGGERIHRRVAECYNL